MHENATIESRKTMERKQDEDDWNTVYRVQLALMNFKGEVVLSPMG